MNENSNSWLREDDQLFKEDVDWWHNACLNYIYDDLDLYIDGYKYAGDLLVEHIKEDRADIDTLVYPIVFLYRQYLELQLKEIIKNGNKLLNIPKKFPTHHNIDILWIMCEKILENALPEYTPEDLNIVENHIKEFSKRDPNSITFRYPIDKNGKKTLPPLRLINLRNLSEVIARIASFLEEASLGISINLEYKADMEK